MSVNFCGIHMMAIRYSYFDFNLDALYNWNITPIMETPSTWFLHEVIYGCFRE